MLLKVKNLRTGFTLVELSIVLVIIGLLIGGILSAQSMIQTVKIQNMIKQFQQYNIAMNNFKLNYNQLPGDSNLFTPPGPNIGYIPTFASPGDPVCNTAAPSYLGIFLITQVFGHLKQSGMIPDQLVGYQPIDCTGGTQTSVSTLQYYNALAGVIYPVFTKSSLYAGVHGAATPDDKIPLRISKDGASLPLHFFTTAEKYDAIALDTKLDDGDPTKGNFLAVSTSVTTNPCTLSMGGVQFCDITYNFPLNND